MAEFFKNVPKIVYEGPNSKNPFAFKHYNADEVVGGRRMSEHLRFAMSYWHTMTAVGSDPFGVGTMDRSYGGGDAMEIAKKRADAAFEFMENGHRNAYHPGGQGFGTDLCGGNLCLPFCCAYSLLCPGGYYWFCC